MSKKLRNNKNKTRILAGELFGRFPKITSKKTVQEPKDEARRGWN